MSLSGIRQLVRDAITHAKTPEPAVIREAVIGDVDSGGVDELVVWALEQLARHELQRLRSWDAVEPRKQGPSKWGLLRRVNLPGLGVGVFVGDEWKWVENCSADDLLAYAADQRRRARELDATADVAERYAEALRASDAATVKAWDKLGRPGALELAA